VGLGPRLTSSASHTFSLDDPRTNSSNCRPISPQLQTEGRGRNTGGGMIELDVKPLIEYLIHDVKRLSRDRLERLAGLFDKLEAETRRLGGADDAKNVFSFELAKELTGRGRGEGHARPL